MSVSYRSRFLGAIAATTLATSAVPALAQDSAPDGGSHILGRSRLLGVAPPPVAGRDDGQLAGLDPATYNGVDDLTLMADNYSGIGRVSGSQVSAKIHIADGSAVIIEGQLSTIRGSIEPVSIKIKSPKGVITEITPDGPGATTGTVYVGGKPYLSNPLNNLGSPFQESYNTAVLALYDAKTQSLNRELSATKGAAASGGFTNQSTFISSSFVPSAASFGTDNIQFNGPGYNGNATVDGNLIRADIYNAQDRSRIHIEGYPILPRGQIRVTHAEMTNAKGNTVIINLDGNDPTRGSIQIGGATYGDHSLTNIDEAGPGEAHPWQDRYNTGVAALYGIKIANLNYDLSATQAAANPTTAPSTSVAAVSTAPSSRRGNDTSGFRGGRVDAASVRSSSIVGTGDGRGAVQSISYRSQDEMGRWHQISAKITYEFQEDGIHAIITDGNDRGGDQPRTFTGEAFVPNSDKPGGFAIPIRLDIDSLDGRSFHAQAINPRFPQNRNIPPEHVFLFRVMGDNAIVAKNTSDFTTTSGGLRKNFLIDAPLRALGGIGGHKKSPASPAGTPPPQP